MTTFNVHWKPSTREAFIARQDHAAYPGATIIGNFVHDEVTDILDWSPNHVFWHHLRDVMYQNNITNMQSIDVHLANEDSSLVLVGDYVEESAPLDTVIGTLRVVNNPSIGTYTFVKSADPDNIAKIVGNKLMLNAALSYATKTSHTVTVSAIHPNEEPIVATYTITVQKNLPSLPLAGRKLYILGDSQAGYHNYHGNPVGASPAPSTLASYTSGYGFVPWTQALDSRFEFESWYDVTDPLSRNFVGANFGSFGDHLGYTNAAAPGIIPRVPAVLAKNPDVVLFNGGFNTLHSNDGPSFPGTAQYCIDKLEEGLKAFRTKGVWVILVVPYETKAWPDGDGRYGKLAQLQQWCRDQSTREGVKVFDCTPMMKNAGVIDLTMLQSDFTHLSVKGAIKAAKTYFLPLVQEFFSAGSVFDQNPATSNLLTSNQVAMTGTGGSKTGTPPPTGNVPDNYAVARGRNCAIVCDVDTDGDGFKRLTLDVTPGGSDSGEYYEISVTIPTYTIVTGEAVKWYKSYFKIDVSEGKDLPFCESFIGFYVGTSTPVARPVGLARGASPDYVKPGDLGPQSFWLMAPPVFNVSASATINGLRGFLRFTGPKTGAPLTIKIGRPIYRETSDPKSAWGY